MQTIAMLVRSMRHHQQKTKRRGGVDDETVAMMQRMMMQRGMKKQLTIRMMAKMTMKLSTPAANHIHRPGKRLKSSARSILLKAVSQS